MRTFNTAGPCKSDIHYMLPPTERLPGVQRLIDQQGYFVVHGPRQSGKTTAMLELARQLTASERYAAVLLSMKAGADVDDIGTAESAILDHWRRTSKACLTTELQPPLWPESHAGARIVVALALWTQAVSRPLVLFLDDIDVLRDNVLFSVLHQLRSGFPDRPTAFPWALALVGQRDIRDFRFAPGGDERPYAGSPFNIVVESLSLQAFTREEVAALFRQHTVETGQFFAPAATERAYELTGGQPWLVNALARQVIEFLVPDVAQPIKVEHIEQSAWRRSLRVDARSW
jgi:hypothetical protein